MLGFREVEWVVDLDCAGDLPTGLSEDVWCEVVDAVKTNLLVLK